MTLLLHSFALWVLRRRCNHDMVTRGTALFCWKCSLPGWKDVDDISP